MRRAIAVARDFYRPPLAGGEKIQSVHHATAAGTGAKILFGAAVGALVGWLAAVFLDTALLVPLVFGALTGEMIGYIQAERKARRPDGAGTIHLDLVLTSINLLTMRRYGTRRNNVLRCYPRDQITAVATKRYPVANYHLQEITTADATTVAFVVEGVLDLNPVN
jgi:hypothetical protein